MRRCLLLVLIAALAAATPSTAATAPQKEAEEIVEPGKKAPGGKLLEWKSAEGKPYWYRVPEKISKKEPLTLLLMLHGTGVPHGWAFWNYPIAKGNFRPNDIVVAPEGMTPGHGDTFNFVQNKDDGDHIAGLIDFFREKYPIDRVYLYGHSQGAFFCFWFAGEYPEHVDGIVAHAGNVLSVKHSKQSKQDVAIGILHTEVDPVVGVECAFRSYEIYREEEYERLKLWVVEGIREQAGHWPLPPHVGEMLTWLDQVCVTDIDQAFDAWEEACKADEPNAGDLVSALPYLERITKESKDKGAQKRLAKVKKEIEGLRDEHIKALAKAMKKLDKDLPYGEWAAHFVAVDSLFADDKEWQKAMKDARKLAAKHDKELAKVIDGMYVDNAKAFQSGVEALEELYLSRRFRELEVRMLRRSKQQIRGVDSGDLQQVETLIQSRAEQRKAGLARAMEVTKKAMG